MTEFFQRVRERIRDHAMEKGAGEVLIYLQNISTLEDREKFETVYREYGGLMYHIAYGVLKHRQDAEDAVHGAFLKISKHMDQIQEPVSLKTKNYVAVSAEHEAIDIWRKKRREAAVRLEESEDEPVAYIKSNTENGLADCILRLPARYRELVLLKYGQGYSLREIAGLFDISLAAAVKLDQRAKRKLKEFCIQEEIL